MGRKIKLIKKTADTQQAGEKKRDFVGRAVKPVKEDYVLETQVGSEEEEVTTIENLIVAHEIKKIDHKGFRQGLQRLDANKGGASSMTETEKIYVGSRFAFSNPIDLFTQFPDVRDRINNGLHDFHSPNVQAREERFNYGASIIYNTVNPSAAEIVIDKFVTPQTANNVSLWTSYVKFGKEGSAFGDADHYIIDYIRSTGSFLGAGLREDIENDMQAVPNNLTVDQVLDAVETVLVEGIYEIP